MKHVSLGGLDVSRIGLSAMTMASVLSVVRKPCKALALHGELVVTSAP